MREFEIDIKNNVIKIPSEYKDFACNHVKVIVMIEDKASKCDFSDVQGKLEWKGDTVKAQWKSGDEW